MAGVMKVEKSGLDGAVVRNILADGSQRDDMAGCVRGAEGPPPHAFFGAGQNHIGYMHVAGL